MFQARSRQHEPAIAFTGGVATYGMLAAATLTATERLKVRGLVAGNLVAVDVRNPFHDTVLTLALGLCGMPSASVQTSFNIELSGLKPDAILVDGNAQHPEGLRLIAIDESWFLIEPEKPADFPRLQALPGFPDDNALVRVVFSSGTTGVPKSTGFTGHNIELRLAHAAFTYGGGGVGGIRAMCLMGFSAFGGYFAMIGALAGGGIACFAQQPAEVLHVIRLFNVDLLILAVVQLQGLLNALGDSRPPPSLRTVAAGGQPDSFGASKGCPSAALRQRRIRLRLYRGGEHGACARRPVNPYGRRGRVRIPVGETRVGR
jgi:acyl-CoA synthetase (AMP-forming)/AMP-acid ligase II